MKKNKSYVLETKFIKNKTHATFYPKLSKQQNAAAKLNILNLIFFLVF